MNPALKQTTGIPSRSPNYPSYDLGSAIEKARVIDRDIGRVPTGLQIIAKVWGSTTSSSTFKATLASLKAFGLIQAHPGGKEPLWKLTPTALDILDRPQGTMEWREAIKKAALKPRIYADIWEQYSGALPADVEIARFLTDDKDFTEQAAAVLISKFRATLAFAQPTQSDNITNEETHTSGDESSCEGTSVQGRVLSSTNTGPRFHQVSMREEIFSLDEGNVVLKWPGGLSEDSVEHFLAFLQLVGQKAKKSAETGRARTPR